MCFSAAAAIAGTETRTYGLDVSATWGMSATLTGKIGVTFSSNYAQLELTDKITPTDSIDVTEYTGYKIVCSEVNNVQLKVTYEDMMDVANGDEYIALSTGTNEHSFLTGHGKVTMLALQDNGSGGTTSSSCIIDAAYLIKAATEEGGETTEEAMVYYTSDTTYNYTFGASYVAYSPEITYSQQYGENYIVNADGTPFTFTSSDEDTYTFTITLAEAADIDLMLESRYMDDSNTEQNLSYNFPGISAGSTSCTFTVNASSVTEHDIAYIKIKSSTSSTTTSGEEGSETTVNNYPATVKFASITAEVTGDDIQGDFDNYFTLPKNVCASDHTIGGSDFTTVDDPAKNTYVADDRTITFNSAYAGYGWWLGGYDETTGEGEGATVSRANVEDYSIYQGIEVAFKTTATSEELIQLVVEYFRDDKCTEGDIVTSATYVLGSGDGENFGTGQTLYIDFSQTYASRMYQIYVQNGSESGRKVQLIGARLIPKSNDEETYSYKVNLAGYATSNWNSENDNITINELDGDDFLGTADLTFTEGYSDNTIGLGWHNWGNTGDGAFNLAQFDEVRIYYDYELTESEVSAVDDEVEEEDPSSGDDDFVIQALYNNSSDDASYNVAQKDDNSDKLITLTVAAGPYLDSSGETVTDFDWTHVGQIVLQVNKACTVKIDSIVFWRNTRTAPEVQTIDLTTAENNSIANRTGGTVYVEGDGTQTGATFSFPLNATGTYDIHLKDGVVINNKNSESTLNAGITIPRGVTVNLYVDGATSVTSSTYGIYGYPGSNLYITMADETQVNKTATTAEDSADDTTEDSSEETIKLDITANYGIYFLGNNFSLLGDVSYYHNGSGDDTADNVHGQTTIDAVYCGMYFGTEVNSVNCGNTKLTVNVSANSDENTPDDMPTGPNPEEGNHYVCAFYYAGNSSQVNLYTGVYKFLAPGTETYGAYFCRTNGNCFYLGWGYFEFQATKCVVHKSDVSNAKYVAGFTTSGDDAIVVLRGPFCAHVDWTDDYNGITYYWYCDGTNGSSVFSSISNLTLRFYDEDADTTGYPLNYAVSSVNMAEYVNRTLKTGWNTVCLPYEYSLDPSDETDVDEDYATENSEVEARTIISKYALFDTLEKKQDESDGSYYYEFTSTSVSTAESPKLDANKAYLLYVDPETEGIQRETTVMFTKAYADLVDVTDDYDGGEDTSESLLTVFHPEDLEPAEDGGEHYKLVNTTDASGNVVNYFNRPLTTMTIPGYRCYLDGSRLSENGETVNIKAIDSTDDNNTTGIQLVDLADDIAAGDVKVYNMGGQLIKIVPAGGSISAGLMKGVYVVDGKKVAVK